MASSKQGQHTIDANSLFMVSFIKLTFAAIKIKKFKACCLELSRFLS